MSSRARNILALIIISTSGFLRFHEIQKPSYLVGEMVSLHFAKMDGWRGLFLDNHPPLYVLLLKYWVSAFGDTEFATRALSALCSVGATSVLVLTGPLVFSARVALLLSTLQALTPLSIQAAQDVRPYALLELLSCINLILFFRFWKFRKSGWAYFVSAPLLCLSHYFGAFLLAIESVWLICFGSLARNFQVKIALRALLALAAAVACYFYSFSWPHLDWQSIRYQMDPSSHLPWELWRAFSFGAPAALLAFFLILAIFLAVLLARGLRSDATVLLSFFIGPILFLTPIMILQKRFVFEPHYFIEALPFYLSWATIVWYEILDRPGWGPPTATLIAALFVSGAVASIPQIYIPKKAPWREAAQKVSETPHSVVLTTLSLSLSTPYFERAHIEVKKMPSPELSLGAVEAELMNSRVVWILETYWSGNNYTENLENQLRSRGYKVTDSTIRIDEAEPIFATQVLSRDLN